MQYRPMPEFNQADINRFWQYVDQPAFDQCWHWRIGLFAGGYGKFKSAGRELKAHRVAYFLFYHIDPLDKFVCHSCDNPTCCNPHHLFLGTGKDNTQDMMAKGRQACGVGERHGSKSHPEKWYRGEQSPLAKLTEDEVRLIRQTYAHANETQESLSKQFGVARRYIGSIIKGEAWSHIAQADGLGDLSDPRRKACSGETNGFAKLTEIHVKQIRLEYARGEFSCRVIAEHYGVSTETVRHAVKRLTWKHVI